MKKIFVAVLGVLFFTPCVFANNWGLGLKVGTGENDPKDLREVPAPYNSDSLDKDGSFYGVEAFYEWNLKDDKDFLGVKLGYDAFGENEYSSDTETFTPPATEESWDYDAKEETYAIPLTIYYKRDNGVKKLSYFAGAGVTLINSKRSFSETHEREVNDIDEIDEVLGSSSTSKEKIFPHLVAGAEYRFTELFALGLEAKYNFNAKVKKHGAVLSDRSGISGALTARFYF
ncbi:MAG: outer membrane beta-barrel protein [Elusimicrobiaceae bacterium]|nr:outer membrane beta-barrel protein [Elusimicrobiaceae bacterium]